MDRKPVGMDGWRMTLEDAPGEQPEKDAGASEGIVLRIGTRSSPMAQVQARRVAEELEKYGPEIRTELVTVTTKADRWQGDLSQLGGKGGFVKEIDRMLLEGEADVAVHCVKDMPGDEPLPEGLEIAAMTSRESPHDVLVVPQGSSLTHPSELKSKVVATSSVRRKAQLRAAYPHMTVVPVRGALETRLEKLDGQKGELKADGMVVARAGLERLGLMDRSVYEFLPSEILPAIGAGVLALVCRKDNVVASRLLTRMNDPVSYTEMLVERALLRRLNGHCNAPIAGLCTVQEDGGLLMRGKVFSPDGSRVASAQYWGKVSDPAGAVVEAVADDLLRQGARSIIDGIPH